MSGARTFGRVLVAIPCYNCAAQVPRVIDRLAPMKDELAGVVVIDNRSTDDSIAAARAALERARLPLGRILKNDDNYGLGGSHKVAFEHALAHGFDSVVILHGDDQGDPSDLLAHWDSARLRDADILLGARFARGSRLQGYSTLRTLGNRAFNLLFAAVLGRGVSDLGSGLNLYRARVLADRFFWRFPDDLTFNYCMVMAHAALGHDARFFPISWREEDQVSNVRLASQARKVLRLLARFARDRRAFLAAELRDRPREAYPSTLVFSTEAGP